MLCKNNNLVYFNFKTITVTHETTLAHYVFIIIVTGFYFYGRRYVCKDRPLFYAAVISFLLNHHTIVESFIFYHCYLFISSFSFLFFRQLPSALSEQKSTKLCHILGRERDSQIHVQNLQKLVAPKQPILDVCRRRRD